MNYSSVTNCDITTDYGRLTGIDMNNASILYIAAPADGDWFVISSNDCVKPNACLLRDGYSSDKLSSLSDECRRMDAWLTVHIAILFSLASFTFWQNESSFGKFVSEFLF